MDALQRRQYFDSQEFESVFHCNLPLGAFCDNQGTLFRLWAPTARKVVLRLYQVGNGGDPVQTFALRQGQQGTWVYETTRNLDGWYYDYAVTVEDQTRETPDPYAKSCGVNGLRSMVLDLRRTDPADWEKDQAPEKQAEQVIYELHIRDFSWDPAGGFDAADRGKFTALTRHGTTLNRDGIHPTGLDYLKRLGVTHVQILPMYDFGSVDEEHPEAAYNWGYDPVNYNIPEGSYSTDPYHGEVRILQMKQMIAALHAAGFRVIMDVVYNHTYHLQVSLWNTAPWYYYRQTETGAPSNGSGCGNDIATERSMCARYILESVLYWAQEYHIDGFRFDLMGLMDVPLMNRIQEELDARFGVGEKLIYGEPWRAADTCTRTGTVLADKGNLKKLNPAVGAFCDDSRDAVKGSVMDAEAAGFVNGGKLRADILGRCITGWAGEKGAFRNPGQTISYLSCHDDWTLWDKLIYTMDSEKRYFEKMPAVLQANRLAAAMLFSFQGRVFFLGGEEFGRTKGGIKNSYCSSAQINQLDWCLAWENEALADYYRGLIALRQQLPGLQDKTENAHKRLLWCRELEENCVAACVDNRGSDANWTQLLLCFNCGSEPQQMELPAGTWQLLVDGESSFRWQTCVLADKEVSLPPASALFLGKPEL